MVSLLKEFPIGPAESDIMQQEARLPFLPVHRAVRRSYNRDASVMKITSCTTHQGRECAMDSATGEGSSCIPDTNEQTDCPDEQHDEDIADEVGQRATSEDR